MFQQELTVVSHWNPWLKNIFLLQYLFIAIFFYCNIFLLQYLFIAISFYCNISLLQYLFIAILCAKMSRVNKALHFACVTLPDKGFNLTLRRKTIMTKLNWYWTEYNAANFCLGKFDLTTFEIETKNNLSSKICPKCWPILKFEGNSMKHFFALQVSISPTVYEQIFCSKVFCAVFL